MALKTQSGSMLKNTKSVAVLEVSLSAGAGIPFFTSLKKTCRKLGVSFWQYLKDRIEGIGVIPDLSDLIRQRSLNPG